jgi:hypothetical protein
MNENYKEINKVLKPKVFLFIFLFHSTKCHVSRLAKQVGSVWFEFEPYGFGSKGFG